MSSLPLKKLGVVAVSAVVTDTSEEMSFQAVSSRSTGTRRILG